MIGYRARREGGEQGKTRASKNVVDIELWYLSDWIKQNQCVGRGIRGKSKKKASCGKERAVSKRWRVLRHNQKGSRICCDQICFTNNQELQE